LKCECPSKTLSSLKNVLQKLEEAFQRLGNGFTELHAKLDADMLLNFVIHRKKKKHGVKKALV
jgi:hypothetical protein